MVPFNHYFPRNTLPFIVQHTYGSSAVQCAHIARAHKTDHCVLSLTSLRWFESVETGRWDHAPQQQRQFLLVGKFWESLLAGTGIADWKKTHTHKVRMRPISRFWHLKWGTIRDRWLRRNCLWAQHSQSRTASCALWVFAFIWCEKYFVEGSINDLRQQQPQSLALSQIKEREINIFTFLLLSPGIPAAFRAAIVFSM